MKSKQFINEYLALSLNEIVYEGQIIVKIIKGYLILYF